MTDAELRDAALVAFNNAVGHWKKTTRGYTSMKQPLPPTSQWAQGFVDYEAGVALLKQIADDPPPPPPPTGTKLGVYVGPQNPAGAAAFGSWLGRPVDVVVDWLAGDSWAAIEGPNWALAPHMDKPYTLCLGVPMFPEGGTLAKGAAGEYDVHFTKLGQALVSRGLGSCILRPGWEFGGGWSLWAVKTPTDAANFAEYFSNIASAMDGVSTGFKFDWNPIWGDQPVNPELAYPGDDYVDFIGIDVYDNSWIEDYTDVHARWNDFMTHKWGALWHRDFAAAHGKPMSFPEWALTIRDDGHGGGDAPEFIDYMADWIAANNVGYHAYFNHDAPDGLHRLTNFPLGQARFQARF